MKAKKTTPHLPISAAIERARRLRGHPQGLAEQGQRHRERRRRRRRGAVGDEGRREQVQELPARDAGSAVTRAERTQVRRKLTK